MDGLNGSAVLSNVHLVLQAGGRGKRMGSDAPKPLQTVAGMPMAERLLRQFVEAGGRRVTVVSGWKGDEIERRLQSLGRLPPGLDLDFLPEGRPRGNAGALAEFAAARGPVLLCFADLVTNLDFAALAGVHRMRGCDVTLCSHYEGHQVRLGELTAQGDRVTAYLEKPLKRFLICSGIAMFEPGSLSVICSDREAGLADVVTGAIEAGYSVTHWLHGAGWIDVNSPSNLAEAERLVASWGT